MFYTFGEYLINLLAKSQFSRGLLRLSEVLFELLCLDVGENKVSQQLLVAHEEPHLVAEGVVDQEVAAVISECIFQILFASVWLECENRSLDLSMILFAKAFACLLE